ncbi:hypothetical protein EVAR_92108_1 [Eumeta japonica]|uniref:Uncharacterized protein n=1 Tax=Eumeta variegata TaxID=151549 RepID=A0A4C1T1S2_EUMVA|nr:hypothetical protein EVAR_92108_1 [Eumeta japonica]
MRLASRECTASSSVLRNNCMMLAARGRPIIVEWERDARHSAGLSRSVTHRYVTERYTFHKILFSAYNRRESGRRHVDTTTRRPDDDDQEKSAAGARVTRDRGIEGIPLCTSRKYDHRKLNQPGNPKRNRESANSSRRAHEHGCGLSQNDADTKTLYNGLEERRHRERQLERRKSSLDAKIAFKSHYARLMQRLHDGCIDLRPELW